MLTLGINQDLYDSGVALTDGQNVLYSANEERFNRHKNQGSFPRHSLNGLFQYTGIQPQDIEKICVAGIMTPPLPFRMFPNIQSWVSTTKQAKSKEKETFAKKLIDFLIFSTPTSHTSADSFSRRVVKPFLTPVVRRKLYKEMRNTPISFVEHHEAHAASAWFLSGFENCLVITADGMGDGVSLTVNRCSEGRIERLWSVASRGSIGMFFEMLTEGFGFTPCRDEGKLTGLAACGDPKSVTIPSPFHLHNGTLDYTGPTGRRGVAWVKNSLASKFEREDVAAWAQYLLEDNVIKIARKWLQKTGLNRLGVAGGLFGNVKLNQRLHELDEVDELFVCPNMGDGGLSLGAICAEGGLSPRKLSNVFFGDDYSDSQIKTELDKADLRYRKYPNIAKEIASRVAEGKIVARFTGRMEWGPRALGNRSILTQTNDKKVVERLNKLLRRSDFMPFAPAALEEDAEQYITGLDGAKHAAEFMTACFDCTAKMKKENPAVVHVDDTARLQVVREEANPAFYHILKEYKALTGHSILLNTSFNIHEEPIVRTPLEAVVAFVNAQLDYLAIGDYLVFGAHIQEKKDGV